MPWKLTVRTGPKVERRRLGTLADALGEAEERARGLAAAPERRTVDTRVRRYEPAEQVAARIELAGPERWLPSMRGGFDVRGDGSVLAYVGRVRRREVEPRRRETVYDALRRELSPPAPGRSG